jgi:hypothetical protein
MCSKLLRIRPPQAETPHLDSLQNAAANINGPANGLRSGDAFPYSSPKPSSARKP